MRLVGGSTITSNAPAIGSEGRTITATFDLTAAPIGPYALIVANPDNTTTSLPNAFTVLQGGGSNISLSLTGLAVSHGGAKAVFELTRVEFRKCRFSRPSSLSPGRSTFLSHLVDPPAIADLATAQADSEVFWRTPALSPGASRVLISTASANVTPSAISIAAGAVDAGREGDYAACIYNQTGGPVAGTTLLALCQNALGFAAGTDFFHNQLQYGCTLAEVSCSTGDANCEHNIETCLSRIAKCSKPARKIIEKTCQNGLCSPQPQNSQFSSATSTTDSACVVSSPIPTVYAIDPNILVGPSGIGGQRWVAGLPALTYIVGFDNEPSAPVPAQQVIVTQPLGTNVNLSSLRLLGITIPNGANDVQAYIPAGALNPSAGVNDFRANASLDLPRTFS